jgi:hypothetical protein
VTEINGPALLIGSALSLSLALAREEAEKKSISITKTPHAIAPCAATAINEKHQRENFHISRHSVVLGRAPANFRLEETPA